MKSSGKYILAIITILTVIFLFSFTSVPKAAAKPPVRRATPVPSEKPDIAAEKEPGAVTKKTPDKPAAVVSKDSKREQKELENENKKLEYIERTLRYGIQKDRKEAINAMLSLKRKENREKASVLLVASIREEPDAEVKARGITVAGDMKLAGAVPEMIRQLEHDSEDVRIAAVNSLRHIKDPACKSNLVSGMQKQDLTKDSNLTESYITALGDFQATDLREFAEGKISDIKTTKNNRELLVLFLGRIKASASKGYLLKMLKDEDEDRDLRGYAANALGHMDAKDAAGDLNGVISRIEAYPFKKRKEYYNLHMYCVAALAKLGDESAFPRLMDALKNDNAVVRLKAIKLIRDMNDKRTIDILKYKRDYDPSVSVQKAARDALVDLGVESASKDTAAPAAKIKLDEREEK